jgi:hypothetical protein
MSGQGAYGVRGPTGPTGINGRKGLQGPATGPTGLGFYSSGGYLPYSIINASSTPTLSPTASTCGSYYVINGATTITVALPSTAPPTGGFWVFKNDIAGGSSPILTITLTNGDVDYYKGAEAATVIQIASGNSLILAYSGTSTTYIVL